MKQTLKWFLTVFLHPLKFLSFFLFLSLSFSFFLFLSLSFSSSLSHISFSLNSFLSRLLFLFYLMTGSGFFFLLFSPSHKTMKFHSFFFLSPFSFLPLSSFFFHSLSISFVYSLPFLMMESFHLHQIIHSLLPEFMTHTNRDFPDSFSLSLSFSLSHSLTLSFLDCSLDSQPTNHHIFSERERERETEKKREGKFLPPKLSHTNLRPQLINSCASFNCSLSSFSLYFFSLSFFTLSPSLPLSLVLPITQTIEVAQEVSGSERKKKKEEKKERKTLFWSRVKNNSLWFMVDFLSSIDFSKSFFLLPTISLSLSFSKNLRESPRNWRNREREREREKKKERKREVNLKIHHPISFINWMRDSLTFFSHRKFLSYFFLLSFSQNLPLLKGEKMRWKQGRKWNFEREREEEEERRIRERKKKKVTPWCYLKWLNLIMIYSRIFLSLSFSFSLPLSLPLFLSLSLSLFFSHSIKKLSEILFITGHSIHFHSSLPHFSSPLFFFSLIFLFLSHISLIFQEREKKKRERSNIHCILMRGSFFLSLSVSLSLSS